MATMIEKMEKEEIKKEMELSYRKAFIEKLGNPAEWRYEGVCVDGGKSGEHCICGHPIRWCFVITNGTRTEIVGSECVNHFKSINVECYEALVKGVEDLKARLAAAKKAAKDAEKDAEIERLKAIYLPMYEKIKSYRAEKMERGIRVPYNVWSFHRNYGKEAPEYKRKADYVRWYNWEIESITKLYNEIFGA